MDTPDVEKKLKTVTDHLRERLDSIRIGRATPAMIENVSVNYYDNPTPLKEVAALSAPEPQQLLVEPWDADSIDAIESALQKADLGANPVVEGRRIRITLPQLTEERRKEFAKKVHEEMEKARIEVRQVREEAWDQAQEQEESGEITEDQKFRFKDGLQEVVDAANNTIEALGKEKEDQLMNRR